MMEPCPWCTEFEYVSPAAASAAKKYRSDLGTVMTTLGISDMGGTFMGVCRTLYEPLLLPYSDELPLDGILKHMYEHVYIASEREEDRD